MSWYFNSCTASCAITALTAGDFYDADYNSAVMDVSTGSVTWLSMLAPFQYDTGTQSRTRSLTTIHSFLLLKCCIYFSCVKNDRAFIDKLTLALPSYTEDTFPALRWIGTNCVLSRRWIQRYAKCHNVRSNLSTLGFTVPTTSSILQYVRPTELLQKSQSRCRTLVLHNRPGPTTGVLSCARHSRWDHRCNKRSKNNNKRL